ncbi:MAG: hypothetical protein KJN75_03385 [Muriicola sp.]|nr:hypothetical protein [Muriicola sp.]
MRVRVSPPVQLKTPEYRGFFSIWGSHNGGEREVYREGAILRGVSPPVQKEASLFREAFLFSISICGGPDSYRGVGLPAGRWARHAMA